MPPSGMHIENIRPGMFVAVFTCTSDGEQETEMTMFGPRTRNIPSTYTGTPLKVLAVSPPFVCVNDGQETYSIDTRRIGVTRLTRAYVKAYHQGKNVFPGKKDGKPEVQEDITKCPQCGGEMDFGMGMCSEGHMHRLAMCSRCRYIKELN
jgi:hypothetical protein